MWRPVLADPPLCSWTDICTVLTVDDVADLHEALDLREAMVRQAADQRKRSAP